MMKKRWIWAIFLIIILAVAGFFVYDNFFIKEKSFTKTSLIKLNIPLGGKFDSSFKIYNPEKTSQNFKVYLNNFEGIASLSEEEFTLGSKEQKEIQIYFDDEKKEISTYVGKLIIEDSDSKEEVPIILGVEDPNHAFAIIQSSVPKYDEVYSGGKLGVEIKVYDLIGANVQTVDASYVIKNLDGDVIDTRDGNLIVGETAGKTELFDIPVDWDEGEYALIISVDYKGTFSSSSYLFTISKKSESSFFMNFRFFIILVLIFLAGIIALVIYFIKSRDSLLMGLKKQQSAEFKRNVEYIKRSKSEILKSKKEPIQKKKLIRSLERAKKNILGKLKKKQKKQIQEAHKLKKTKKKGAVKNKMDEWKKQGYKMFEADKEVKKVTKKGINQQVKDWKNKGYDTSFLK